MRKIACCIVIAIVTSLCCYTHTYGQSCTCNNYGPELILNGDFEQGNSGFASDYLYSTTTAGSGKYGISSMPWSANMFWSHCSDHTSGSGNMMWVDCSITGTLTMWSETIATIYPNTDYVFSCWVSTLDLNGPSTLLFSVNGLVIGNPFTAPVTTCEWVQVCFIWNSGTASSAIVSVSNESQFGVGNDVALDDISFRACCSGFTGDSFVSLCEGSSYLLPGGSWVNTAGDYTDTLTTVIGCDSIILTHLSILPATSSTQNISICDGQSFYAGGAFQTQSGTFIDTVTNASGCDSVVTTNLTVFPNSIFSQNISICSGDSIFIGGSWQKQGGSYIDHYTNFLGCDSALTTNLLILPTSSSSVNVSICNGESYFAGGGLQTTTGIYTDTFLNYLGCDSIFFTNLTVLPTSANTINPSICDGQSYFAGGAFQTVSGVYLDTFTNTVGCDSVLTTNLTVLSNTASIQNISICDGQSYYAGGSFQTQSGVYTDTISNAAGCDSIVTTNLTVLPNSSSTRDISICSGDSIFTGGAWQTQAGIYVDHFTNYVGCDSLLTTNLSVLSLSAFTLNAAICDGQSYYAGGANQTTSGTYTDILVNNAGCDSILTTNLTVLPNSSFTVNTSICDGQSYFAGGAFQTTSGIYLDTFNNAVGCDSVVTTYLTVLNTSAFLQDTSICDGQSYYAAGAYQTQTGVYLDTFTNVVGCDSIVTTNLTVLPNTSFTQNIFICFGDSVFAGSAWQKQSGIYLDHYTNFLGCDSVLTTNLTVHPLILTYVSATICNGDTYYAGGMNQSQSGLYIDTLTAVTGCDSILHTSLTVLPPIITEVFPSICEGQQYYAGSAWQHLSGVYFDTLTSSMNCDSAVISYLTVNPNPIVQLGNDTAICAGTTIELNAGEGFNDYQWNNQSSQQTSLVHDSGTYWVTVTDSLGCKGSDTLIVTGIFPLPVNFIITDTSICGNIPITVGASGYPHYFWYDGDSTAFHSFDEEGTYWLQVTDSNNCSAIETLSVHNICDNDIMVPNAFTPNGDGVNDVFLPVIIKRLTQFHMTIFNRWGMVIFESNDPAVGWNGVDIGKSGEIGTYLWSINYTLESGTTGTLSGYVTLLR